MPDRRVQNKAARTLKVPKLDEDRYFFLIDLLFGTLLRGNYAKAGRLLGVSPRRIEHMRKTLPASGKQWWWNIVLNHIIVLLASEAAQSSHKVDRKVALSVRHQLERSKDYKLMDELYHEEANRANCSRVLLATLSDSNTGMMSLNKLRRPGVMGGYSERAIRQAAEKLQLIKEQRGGKTYYRLPSLEDLKEEDY